MASRFLWLSCFTLFSFFLNTAFFALNAQNLRCFSDEMRAKKLAALPKNWLKEQEGLEKLRLSQANGAGKTNETLYRIPVVVHIVHQNGPENISDEQVRSQIQVLNEDYQKISGSSGDGNGASAEIEFYLAQKDPDGNKTNGINRIESPFTVHDPDFGTLGSTEEQLKGLALWNPAHYLNIWVVNKIGLGDVLGYANFPDVNQPALDGLVIGYKFFGRDFITEAPYNKGRTTTHEIGHWLGLYHIFEDGCAGNAAANCLQAGDRVCDTPPAANPRYGCEPPPVLNTCSETPTDANDLLYNYLDYHGDACMNNFTAGQVARLRQQLTLYRAEMLKPENWERTGYGLTERYEPTPKFNVKFYPNPVLDIFNLEIENLKNDNISIEVSTITGDIVKNISVKTSNGYLFQQIDLQGLNSGIYLLKMRNRLSVQTYKIVKLH